MPVPSFRPLGAIALAAVLPVLADMPTRIENRGTKAYILTASGTVTVQEAGGSGASQKAFNGAAIMPGKSYIVQHGSSSTLTFSPIKNSGAKPSMLYSGSNADKGRAVVISFLNNGHAVKVELKDTSLGQAIAVDPTKIGHGTAKKGTPFLTLGVRGALNGGGGSGSGGSSSGGSDASSGGGDASNGGGDASNGGSDPSSGGGSDPSQQPDPNS